MKKVALTGNMGTGKSYVSRCLQEQGLFVLDMDVCAKEVRASMQSELLFHFHVSDAKQLASLIFANEKVREQLEQLMYPKMIEKMQLFFADHEEEKMVVVEVPLLFEKGWEIYFDEIWCVTCTKQTALKRLMEKRGFSYEQAEARWTAQMPMEEKMRRSDMILYNEVCDDIQAQIRNLLERGEGVC